MSIIKNGGPAYPVETQSTGSQDEGEYGHQASSATWQFPGMTLRDHFAAKAMQGCFTSPIAATQEEKEYIALHAYRMADAMLKAREAA
jgi:hypothetical protein